VKVGDDGFRPGVEEPEEMGQGLFEIAEIPVVVEVSQKLAGDDVAVLIQRDGVLELAAEGDERGVDPEPFGDGLRVGDVAPGPADEERAAARGLDHGVVGPNGDRAVVGEDGVAELADAFLLVLHDRGVLGVGARGHDELEPLEKEMVERRVGQHEADFVEVGGDEGDVLLFFEQDDRPARRLEKAPFGRRDGGEALDDAKIAGHEGQRLGPPGLRPAQPGDGLPVERVADKVESAESLDGQDFALEDEFDGLGDRVVERAPRPRVVERQARPADRAGDGLGVMPAVEGVLVFPPAVRAHRETRHGRPGPVVGQVPDDRVAGPAVSAVGEGITVAALSGRRDLLEALGAGGDIGRDEDEPSGVPGCPDLEAPEALDGRGAKGESLDGGQGRQAPAERGGEFFEDGGGRPFNMDLDPRAGILDPAVEPEAAGEAVDAGPEPDALDDAEDR
jgi:hypothetical protein